MIDKFNDFENRYNLFDLTIDDFSVWPYIRFEMYFKIGEFFGVTNGVGSTPKTKITDSVIMFWNTFVNNPVRSIKQHDILIIPHQRRIKEGGKYRCIYTDELAARLDYPCVTAEFLFGRMHYKPAKTENMVYLDCVDVWPAIKYKVHRNKDTRVLNIAEAIVRDVDVFFGIDIDRIFVEELICKRYYWHRFKKPIIKKFIKRVKPKIIIELVGYETNKMIINEVAHEMSIPCVELQHGVIGRGHIAYNYSGNHELEQLPSYLFVYSNYWKDTCSFPIPKNHIIPVGYPYMEEQIKKYPKKNEDNIVRIIVFSSTDHTEFIKNFTEEAIRLLDESGINYRIIYKLHPLEYNYDPAIWSKIKTSTNVVFIDQPKKSLYELCAEADIQIGVKTTAVFEGLSYGLKTFILHSGAPDIDFYMGDLVKQGYAIYGRSAEDFIDFVKDYLKSSDNFNETNNNFFELNSLDNMKKEIERIICLNE